jgi:hypothetical protein
MKRLGASVHPLAFGLWFSRTTGTAPPSLFEPVFCFPFYFYFYPLRVGRQPPDKGGACTSTRVVVVGQDIGNENGY